MIDRIVLPNKAFLSSGKWKEADRVQLVVDHVNRLIEDGSWDYSELPKLLLDVYYCDYLMAQVLNGGFAQFFYNSQGKCNAIVSAGLKALNTPDYSTLFDRATKLAEKHNELNDEIFEELDEQFFELNNKISLTDLNYALLEKSQKENIELVSDEDYDAYIKSVTTDDPKRNGRKESYSEELAAAEVDREVYDFWDGVAGSFCSRNELEYLGLNEFDTLNFEGNERQVVYFCVGTKDELRDFAVVVDDDKKFVFLDGESHEVLCREEQSTAS